MANSVEIGGLHPNLHASIPAISVGGACQSAAEHGFLWKNLYSFFELKKNSLVLTKSVETGHFQLDVEAQLNIITQDFTNNASCMHISYPVVITSEHGVQSCSNELFRMFGRTNACRVNVSPKYS